LRAATSRFRIGFFDALPGPSTEGLRGAAIAMNSLREESPMTVKNWMLGTLLAACLVTPFAGCNKPAGGDKKTPDQPPANTTDSK
jgi:hypothetical protein